MNTNDKLRELIRSPLSTAVEVTQVDREAASDLINAITTDETLRRLHEGGLLPIPPARLLLPAFARHRQASIAQQAEEVARLRDIVCDAVEDYCSDMPDLAGHGHSIGLKDEIRAALNEQPGGEGKND